MSKSVTVTAVLLVLLCFVHTAVSQGGKIVGGEPAVEGQFPFMVQLATKSDHFFFCGGSLIGPYHILTAAHCTDGQVASEIQIWAGSLDHNSEDGVFINVDTIYQHPDYVDVSQGSDVSVIKLKTPFPRTTGVKTIALAKNQIDAGTDVLTSGWGTTSYGGSISDLLLFVEAPVISTSACRAFSGYDVVIGSQMICVYADGKDSCQGDSGGPLFTGEGADATVHGIVSWGYGCGTAPGIYTRVSHFREWITLQTNHIVATPCEACSDNAAWEGMCVTLGGTYKKTTSQYQCRDLDVLKVRKISATWNNCGNDLLRNFCEKVGRYSCQNGTPKCSRL